jgi:hypothetical protein
VLQVFKRWRCNLGGQMCQRRDRPNCSPTMYIFVKIRATVNLLYRLAPKMSVQTLSPMQYTFLTGLQRPILAASDWRIWRKDGNPRWRFYVSFYLFLNCNFPRNDLPDSCYYLGKIYIQKIPADME